MADQGNPFLRRAQRRPSRHHRLGAGALQVRQHRGGRQTEAAVRFVLHQEYVPRPGLHDHVPDHQDCAVGPGGAMRWLFWGAAAVLTYTYFGYPGWLWLRRLYRPRPVMAASYTPSISVVMIVRNEAAVLERKLQNLLALDYPPELSEIIIFSDGSTDATNDMLRESSIDERVRVVLATE